jgi:MoaA/NifB/PqqE/SkfB family radical SAM enzyme
MSSTRHQLADVPVAEVIAEHGVARAIQLKHVASVLYTYRCTLSCRHCCFNSRPGRPNVHTSLEDGLEQLRQLHTTDRVIHIAGGEAMIYYDDMIELCREANREGVAPHFIETNATWCRTEEIAYARMNELVDAGVEGLLISACPHHQRECPPERYERCERVAEEVFGGRNVAAGRLTMEQLEGLVAVNESDESLGAYVRQNTPMLSGRAGDELARFFPDRPIEELADDPMWHGPHHTMDCAEQFDPERMWEIHIDPYGNVQTCCLVVIGNIHETPLPELMKTGFLAWSPVVRAVYEEGPLGLLKLAEALGYERRAGYPQKCGMCWEIRKFLRPHYPEALAPDEVYDP